MRQLFYDILPSLGLLVGIVGGSIIAHMRLK